MNAPIIQYNRDEDAQIEVPLSETRYRHFLHSSGEKQENREKEGLSQPLSQSGWLLQGLLYHRLAVFTALSSVF
jgi:hypothetical protein